MTPKTKTDPKNKQTKPKMEFWQAIANREASRVTQSDYKKKQLQHFKPKPKHRKAKK